ncbi:MAG: hypothetical protein IJ481_01135 [Alphaproteobacteria bacterium]|nr:hypothetical protein [Alphaproteobacteria bacterium]
MLDFLELIVKLYKKTTSQNFNLVKQKAQEYLSDKYDYQYNANPNTINKFLKSIGIHDDNLTNKYAVIQIKRNKENACNIKFSVPLQFCYNYNTYDQMLFTAIYYSNGNLRTNSYTPIDMALDENANINVVSDDIFNQFEKGKIYRIYQKGRIHDKHRPVFVQLDESNNDTNIKILKSITDLASQKTQQTQIYNFKLISESTANRLKKKADGSEYSYVLCVENQMKYAGYKLYVNKSDLDNFIFIDKTLAKLNNHPRTINDFFGAQKYSKIRDLKDYITVIDN